MTVLGLAEQWGQNDTKQYEFSVLIILPPSFCQILIVDAGKFSAAVYTLSSPVLVPVLLAKVSLSIPRRCSRDTKRLHSGAL